MDPAIRRAAVLTASDIARQFAFKKGSVNAKKALVVGGASYVSAKFLKSFADSLLLNLNITSVELQMYLSELLGISGALWIMKESGLVSKGNIETAGSKSGDLTGAMVLALQDMAIAYVAEMVLNGTYGGGAVV
jgi:hypothetical protein